MQVQPRPFIRRTGISSVYVDSTKSSGLLLPCLFGQTAAQVRLGFQARNSRTNESCFKSVHKNTDANWWAATAAMSSDEFNEAAQAFIAAVQ